MHERERRIILRGVFGNEDRGGDPMTTARALVRLSIFAALVLFRPFAAPAAEPAKNGPAKVPSQAAASPGPITNGTTTAPRGGAALRDETMALLRSVARQPGKPDDAVVRRAVALYREIQLDTQLRASQREPLRVALRNKLVRWGEQLAQEQSAAPGRAVASPASVQRPKALAQIGPPGLPGQMPGTAPPPVDHGQELMELIQDTIAPTKWDVHGGNGVVRYWAPGHALIVRQTGDVHEQLGRLLMDMR
jgi:hypothetical protein